MLNVITRMEAVKAMTIPIKDAAFPAPFPSVLEYNAPVRGPWNIVNTGMLVPQSHQVFVCAQGCLRGVILTAAEMNAMDRMSWVTVDEDDLVDGTMEQDIVDGTERILRRMGTLPRAVLVFVSCVHLFAGCDVEHAIKELGKRFPEVDFLECFMTPTMRKSGLTPDQLTRRQMYCPLRPVTKDPGSVNIIGNDLSIAPSSELLSLLHSAFHTVRDITWCRNYEEFLQMAQSSVNLTTHPMAIPAGEELERRLGQKHLHLPLSYDPMEIIEGYRKLCELAGISLPDFTQNAEKAEEALRGAKQIIGDTPIAIDYTATPRPLSLARMLLSHGFSVTGLYTDTFLEEDKNDYQWLKEHHPNLSVTATVAPSMRFAAKGSHQGQLLAIGQKAAYFSGTRHFVNIVSGGGMYGFDGIVRLAHAMTDALREEKDTRLVIQRKALGCESCL